MTERIDKNIKTLVDIVNKYPGIKTTGSCGGHKRPNIGQLNENEFYIQIDICAVEDTPSKIGWNSLGKISQATMEYIPESRGIGKISIEFCNLSDTESDENGVCNYFEIHGVDVDRNVFAQVLVSRLYRG